MARRGLDAFLVPRADEHQGEYVPPSAERLRWITGFTGSAGMAAIGRRAACLFVDGRYTMQARHQVDTRSFRAPPDPRAEAVRLADGEPARRRARSASIPGCIRSEIERLQAAVAKRALRLKPASPNPLDRAWGKDRPAAPAGAVIVQPLQFAGTPRGRQARRAAEAPEGRAARTPSC